MNFFGKTVKAEWIPSIQLSKTRETEIQSCFYCHLSFNYPHNLETFDDLLEYFKPKKSIANTDSVDNNSCGENKKTNCLLVMDNISGLADRWKRFESFVTIARKHGFHSVYIFHIILPGREIWKKLYWKRTFLVFFQPLFQFKL